MLEKHWSHSSFRPGQWEAIDAVLNGTDTLAVLPTGGGKSLLYQLPAVLMDGLTLVISPLVALMEDQVQALHKRGIRAGSITSSLSARKIDQCWTDAEFGKYELLYVTPERLRTDLFLARAERLPVALLAVDEAHCISEWGHDFRPSYRQIAEVRPLLTSAEGRPAPILAVTATATPAVRRDIVEQLALEEPCVVVRGFDRPNIVWSVLREEDKRAKLIEIADAVPGSGLVYAGTRKRAELWAEALREEGIPAEAYHAGLDAETRSGVQQRWLEGSTRYIAATSAFGMGIDKPDVRVVAHVALPPTLESYYQEAGRAGRDGDRAHAVLLVTRGDDDLPRTFAEEGHPDAKTVQVVYAAVGSIGQIAIGSEPDGPVSVDVRAVGRVAGVTSMVVASAVQRLATEGVWHVAPSRPNRALVRAMGDPDVLRAYAARLAEKGNALAVFVDVVRRTLPPEAYSGWAEVDLRYLAKRAEMEAGRVLDGLLFLAERDLLEVLPPASGLRVVFNGPREERVILDARALARSRRRALSQLDDVIRYSQSLTCRRQFLLAYFGERSAARCGTCDVCLGRHRPLVVTPKDESLLRRILNHVEDGDAREAWLEEENLSANRRDGLGDWLVNEGYLNVVDPLTDTLALTPKALRLREKDTPD